MITVKEILRWLLAIALLALIAINAGCGDGEIGSYNCISFKSSLYESRVAEFKMENAQGGIVYAGDSRVQLCGEEYPEFFGPLNRNRGIGSASITDMTDLASDVINPEAPGQVYMLIGINDELWGKSPECMEQQMSELEDALDTPMTLISIEGVPTYDGLHYDRAACMEIFNRLRESE
jgi:hypothetical protein